jgi:hypothetical protein
MGLSSREVRVSREVPVQRATTRPRIEISQITDESARSRNRRIEAKLAVVDTRGGIADA